MNRIAQRALSPEVADRLVLQHEQLTAALRGAVPPSVLGMFARPVQASAGQVQWLSHVAGVPQAYRDLTTAQAESLLSRLQQRLITVNQSIDQLESRQTITGVQAKGLRQMVAQIPQDALVSIDGEPFVLYGRSALNADQQVPLLPMAAMAAVVAATAATPAVAQAAMGIDGTGLNPSATAVKRRCTLVCLGWLLGFLLLLLITFALWWFFCPLSPRQAPSLLQDPSQQLTTEDLTITIPPPTAIDPIELWQPVRVPLAPPKACPAEIACPQPEPPPPPPPPPPPEPAPKPPVAKKPPVKKPPVTAQTAKDFCAGERPPELAPEVVVVFDHSGSMRLNIDTTPEQENQIMQAGSNNLLLQLLGNLPNSVLDLVDKEPRRITVAKKAVTDVVKRLPSDVNAGLVTLGHCPNALNRGFFNSNQRGALLSQIDRLEPERGTPLADAIWRAANMVDGVNRESMILVVTDGDESCDGDPCAIARELAAAKPLLTINVVDIGNSGAGNCLAAAGRGKVFTARTAAELDAGVRRAVQDVLGPSNCKPN